MVLIRILLSNLLLIVSLVAQFVDVQVTIDDRRLKENHRRITTNLGNQIKLFFESTLWDEEYSDLEIPLTIQFIFDSISEKGGNYIYSAQCLLSNRLDQRYFAKVIQFPYVQGQGIVFSPVIFEPLASSLGFYGYLILAGEADTYEQFGGTRFYELARELTLRGRSSQYPRGWSDRIDLVDQLSKNRGYRLAKYYFYEGFAYIEEGDFTNATLAFNKMIDNYTKVFQKFPRERYTIIFLNAHAQELANLPKQYIQRNKILKTMIQLDPDNEKIYQTGLDTKSE